MRTSNVRKGEGKEIHQDFLGLEVNPVCRDAGQGMHDRSRCMWLYTFSDLVLLLLAFFVMLYAMGTPDGGGFRALAEGLSTRPQPLVQREVAATSPDFSVDATDISFGQNVTYLRALIHQSRQVDPDLNNVVISMSDDRLVLSLPGDVLFKKAGSRVRSDGLVVVAGVANLLSYLDNQVVVAARSDANLRDREAWALSLARARAVARALRSSGYMGQARLIGYGASRPVAGVVADQVQPVDVMILPERSM